MPPRSRRRATFRVAVWDPPLIIAQIVCVQTLYYAALGLLTLVIGGLAGTDPGVEMVLGWRLASIRDAAGATVVLAHALAAVAGAAALMIVVQRARQCLDFASTLLGLHLVVVWLWAGIPRSLVWWALWTGSLLACTSLGERMCLWREMTPIDLLGGSAAGPGEAIPLQAFSTGEPSRAAAPKPGRPSGPTGGKGKERVP